MPFTEFPNEPQQKALNRERASRLKSTPFTMFQYVDVTFPSGGVDVDIPHTLTPAVPDTVRWIIVSINAPAVIYRDTSVNAKSWQETHIWLRANAACTTRLLLVIEVK